MWEFRSSGAFGGLGTISTVHRRSIKVNVCDQVPIHPIYVISINSERSVIPGTHQVPIRYPSNLPRPAASPR